MIRINLLPHREEKRKARREQFYVLFGLVIVLGCLVVLLMYSVIEGQIAGQEGRNKLLTTEIAKLDSQIDEIKRLKEQTQALLARKQIIESLQRDRGDTVRLLSELVKQMPEGVYLTSLKQDGLKVTLVGYAQAEARVSTLMRNVEASAWLERPGAPLIKKATVGKRDLYEFTLDVFLKRAATEEGGKK